MSSPVLSNQDVISLFQKGVDYAHNKFKSSFFKIPKDMVSLQKRILSSAQDINSIMNVVWMSQYNPAWVSAFEAPVAVCDECTLQLTPVQFGIGHLGWYFVSGVAGKYGFNICFYRLEIAPKKVVDDFGIMDRSQAVRWLVVGGFGPVGGNIWYSLPGEWIYMDYSQPSFSTFSLSGKGNNMEATLSSLQPMQFSIDLNYTAQDGQNHKFHVEMISRNPPSPAASGSCAECVYNLGSMYYSYTSCDLVVKADNDPQSYNGTGWVDHQLLKMGLPNSKYIQAIETVNNIKNKAVTGGWLWYSIQDDESGIQYMLSHSFGNKEYVDDIKLNKNIPMGLINVYKDAVSHFTPTSPSIDSSNLKVAVSQFIQVPQVNMNLPASYDITLPGGKQVVLSIATAPNVYTIPSGCYETPAYLFNPNNPNPNVPIGVGLIEANLYQSNKVMARKILEQFSNSPSDADISSLLTAMENNQSSWVKFLAVVLVLCPLVMIILAVLLIVKRDDPRKRINYSIAILFVILIYLII